MKRLEVLNNFDFEKVKSTLNWLEFKNKKVAIIDRREARKYFLNFEDFNYNEIYLTLNENKNFLLINNLELYEEYMEYINFLFRKNPTWKSKFLNSKEFKIWENNILKNEKNILNKIENYKISTNFMFYVAEEFGEYISNYSNLLSKKININDKKFDNFKIEDIFDLFDLIIKEQEVEKYIKSFFSKKTIDLICDEDKKINKEIFQYFSYLKELDKKNKILKNDVRSNITKKINTINNKNDFLKVIKKFINELDSYEKSDLKEKIKKDNLEIVYEKIDKVVLKINKFEDIQKYGSLSWCLLKNKEIFDSYVYPKYGINYQYILFDFSKKSHKKESMIGLTIDINKGIEAAHFKDDSLVDFKKNEYINDFLNYLKISEKEKENQILNNKNISKDKYLKYYYAFKYNSLNIKNKLKYDKNIDKNKLFNSILNLKNVKKEEIEKLFDELLIKIKDLNKDTKYKLRKNNILTSKILLDDLKENKEILENFFKK